MNSKARNAAFAYSTIGLQLAATILIFLYIGFKVDANYNTKPWFTLIGGCLGMAASFYHLLKGLKSIEAMKDNSEGTPEKKSNKWL